MRIVEYVDASGSAPFAKWFGRLDGVAAAKVTAALARLEVGNTGHLKSVGSGIFELKIDFGPGYRVYFGFDGREAVVLLGGGSKHRQQADILRATDRWKYYRQSKASE